MDSRAVNSDMSRMSTTNGQLSPEIVYAYFALFQDGLKNLTEKLNKHSASLETILENEKELKTNYAAINAQLHIIQERLRAVEENNTLPYHSTGAPSAHSRYSDLSMKIGRSSNASADELSGTETIHKECLTEHLELMVKNLDLGNTSLLDDLLGEDCLTQDEASGIREGPHRKDQIRKLVILIAKRSKGKFVKFLATIEKKEYYPYIAKCLKDSYEKRTSEDLNKDCLLCTIKQDVDVKDVVDKLCKHKLVDIDFLDLVVKNASRKDQSHLWEVIFSHVDNAPNRLNAIKILQEALTIKHEHLSAKLGQSKHRQFSSHQCLPRAVQQAFASISFDHSWRSTSSIGDMSSTSDRPERSSAGPEKDSIEEYPVQSTEISSTSSNLPLTIEWVMKHNQMLAITPHVHQTASSSKTTQQQQQFNQMDPLQSRKDIKDTSSSDNVRSTIDSSSTKNTVDQTLDAHTVQDQLAVEHMAEHFQQSLWTQRPASAETKEKRKSFRKRKQRQIKLDVEKASEKTSVAVESKETQTPETCLQSGGFSFPEIEKEMADEGRGKESGNAYGEGDRNEGKMNDCTETSDSDEEEDMGEVT